MRVLGLLSLPYVVLALAGCAAAPAHQQAPITIANFDQVSATLYRGGQPSEAGMQLLQRQYHVKTVIDLRDDALADEARWAKEAGMTYVHLPWNANQVTAADAEDFLAAFSKAQTPVFVHCQLGRDRTGLAVAAYRICVERWTEQAAEKDLIDHGHYWILFPKVRQAIAALAKSHAPNAR